MAHFKGIWAEDFLTGVFNDTFVLRLLIFFIKAYIVRTFELARQVYKSICCGNSFELPRLVEAIQMSTHNIC